MGYRKIDNLHKSSMCQLILELPEVYAMEKIHGTSGHVAFDFQTNKLSLFSGGVKSIEFEKVLIDKLGSLEALAQNITLLLGKIPQSNKIVFFGEIYGGKCQKMSHVYGPLNFIGFEVKLDDVWLTVPEAELLTLSVGLEFVHYERGKPTVEWLAAQRDKDSTQAIRNGCGSHIGEGIVIRPIVELRDKFGNRVMAKHKTAKFSEVKTPREIDPNKAVRYEQANVVADEFVNEMRLMHVCDKLRAGGLELNIKATGQVVRATIADIRIEEGDSIDWSNEVEKTIGQRASTLYRQLLDRHFFD